MTPGVERRLAKKISFRSTASLIRREDVIVIVIATAAAMNGAPVHYGNCLWTANGDMVCTKKEKKQHYAPDTNMPRYWRKEGFSEGDMDDDDGDGDASETTKSHAKPSPMAVYEKQRRQAMYPDEFDDGSDE